jgi:serine/threonine protein kinase
VRIAEPMNLVGQVLENRYKLREPIGVGGMGTVYLAEHVLLGEVCAVKVLSPRFAFDPE